MDLIYADTELINGEDHPFSSSFYHRRGNQKNAAGEMIVE
jgi:hypothetical protein